MRKKQQKINNCPKFKKVIVERVIINENKKNYKTVFFYHLNILLYYKF